MGRRRRRRSRSGAVSYSCGPQAPNDVCSVDFLFDRTAEGCILICLTIVDDAEAVA